MPFKENHVNPRHFHEIDFRESNLGWIALRTGLLYFQQITNKKANHTLENCRCIIEVVTIKLKIYSQENYGNKAKPKFVFK